MKEYITELSVNDNPVELNHFTAQFVAHTVAGAAQSLKGVSRIKDLVLVSEDGKPGLTISGKKIPLSAFPRKVIEATLRGLLSTLKGVSEIKSYRITVSS